MKNEAMLYKLQTELDFVTTTLKNILDADSDKHEVFVELEQAFIKAREANGHLSTAIALMTRG